MATASSEVEKKCPLCAEEMDWTDQQLKPCKCGYEVCVWCWHHIMDMAEKDETEGRCPACRAPYDKEKIVGMQAKCERVVLKKDREIKPQKSKPKKPEEKKDLSNVRVIQRKMAYVIGLPLSLADEDILQQRDYFGQYGKVTKVSLSRTAGGAIQQFVNDSCSVYVTYSKEEEAVRCIQSVHGFLLEGRALRASFGTAKYCHAWLKNTVCNNAACLYLHTFGADEDSFGKDEEAAVHTRNRVHQIVGAARNMQWRSGSTLPPPLDEPLDSNDTDTDKINLNNWNIELTSSVLLNCSTSPKDQDERLKTPNRSFLDVVARPSTGPNQGNIAEDHNLLNICSNISTLVIDECCTDTEHSNDMSSKVSSTCPSPIAVLDKDSPYSTANSFREPECHHLPLPGKESQNPPKYSDSNVTEYSKEQSCLTSSNSSQNNLEEVHSDRSNGYAQNCIETSVVRRDINADSRNINIYSNQVSEPFSVFNSSSANEFQDKKMRSNSFSGEEIVGQLRKLDDNSLTTNIDSFALETVESNIVSSILSLDFDSCDDALSLPRNVTDMYGGSDERNGSLWNSTKSENSRFSFAKEDSYATNFSLFSDYMGKDSMKNDNLYSSGPQNNGLRTQSSAPPGFSLTIRDAAPPGFSSSEMTNQLHPPSSGSYMVNPVSYPKNHYSAIPNGHIRSASDFNYNNQHYPMSNGHTRSVSDMDFNDPAILAVQGGGKLTKGINHSGLNSWQTSATTQFPNSAPQFINSAPQYTNSDPQFTNSAPQFMNSAPQFMNNAPQFTNSAPQFTNSTPQFTNYDEEARLWLSTQQGGATQQGTNFAPTFLQDRPSFHQEQNYISNGDRFPYMGNSFGANSKIMTNQNQDYNSAYSQIPQQKYGNGHVPNGIYNIQEVQRNDRLGFDNLYSGHRDLVYQVPNTGDVYNRVYGL